MDLTPAHFSPAPAHSTPGTVDGLQPGNPGTPTVSVPWGSIVGNLSNQTDLTNALAAKANTADLNAHVNNHNNPHEVTKALIGLPDVENVSPMDMPVSIAQAAAIAGVSIPAGQITDASALGRALLTNATADEDLDDLGAGANGKLLFAGATAATNRTNLGATAIGANIFTAADVPAVRDLIGLPLMPFGQCYLLLSGGLLTLSRRNGKYLFINGAFREIPAAGVTLAATGLTVGTTYNIYAFWTGSAIQLEASTTARATDANWGHQIKSGDATRSLVGKAYVNTGPTWIDTTDTNGVISWYNRVPRRLQGVNTIPSYTTTTPSEILSGNSRCYFLSWGEDAVHARCHLNGNITPNGPVAFLESRIYWGSGGIINGTTGYQQAAVSGTWGMLTSEIEGTPIENSGGVLPGNLCYATAFGWFNTAGGTYNIASGSVINRLTFYG